MSAPSSTAGHDYCDSCGTECLLLDLYVTDKGIYCEKCFDEMAAALMDEAES